MIGRRPAARRNRHLRDRGEPRVEAPPPHKIQHTHHPHHHLPHLHHRQHHQQHHQHQNHKLYPNKANATFTKLSSTPSPPQHLSITPTSSPLTGGMKNVDIMTANSNNTNKNNTSGASPLMHGAGAGTSTLSVAAAAANAASIHPLHTFTWPDTRGERPSVMLVGSFDNFLHHRMHPPRPEGPDVYTLTLPVPPGSHTFKFLVGGNWQTHAALHSSNPISETPDGVKHHRLLVAAPPRRERRETSCNASSPMPQDSPSSATITTTGTVTTATTIIDTGGRNNGNSCMVEVSNNRIITTQAAAGGGFVATREPSPHLPVFRSASACAAPMSSAPNAVCHQHHHQDGSSGTVLTTGSAVIAQNPPAPASLPDTSARTHTRGLAPRGSSFNAPASTPVLPAQIPVARRSLLHRVGSGWFRRFSTRPDGEPDVSPARSLPRTALAPASVNDRSTGGLPHSATAGLATSGSDCIGLNRNLQGTGGGMFGAVQAEGMNTNNAIYGGMGSKTGISHHRGGLEAGLVDSAKAANKGGHGIIGLPGLSASSSEPAVWRSDEKENSFARGNGVGFARGTPQSGRSPMATPKRGSAARRTGLRASGRASAVTVGAPMRVDEPRDVEEVHRQADNWRQMARHLQEDLRDPSAARQLLEKAISHREKHGLAGCAQNAQVHADLARNLSKADRLADAESHLRDALNIYRDLSTPPEHIADLLLYVGVVVDRQKRRSEAERLYRKALGMYMEQGSTTNNVDIAVSNLALNLRKQGRENEVEPMYREFGRSGRS